MTLSIIQTYSACGPGLNVSFSGVGGTEPYTYSIIGPVKETNNTGVFVNLPAGDYQVSAMDKAKIPQGATVLDPYMGSGTTGIACLRTARNFIGIEQDAAHYKTACDRIAHELEGALL